MLETTERVGGAGSRRRSALFLVALLALLSIGFWASRKSEPVSTSRITILLSLDRTWFHRVGLSRYTYVRSLTRAGARVRVLDYSALQHEESPEATARRALEGVDGLVLSGGGDVDPSLYKGKLEGSKAVSRDRDRFELALLELAEQRGLPILGICRGSQLLNVARGGSLHTIRSDRTLRRRHGRYLPHSVDLEADSRLAELLGTARLERVVSYHGQAVDRPGEGLVVVGRSDDGVAEAIEPAAGEELPWLIGVQWHPELSPRSRLHRKLFEGLVSAARRSRSTTG